MRLCITGARPCSCYVTCCFVLIGVENLNSRCIRCGGAAACRNVSFSEFVYTSSGVKSRPDDTAITIMDISCRPEYCIYSTVVFKRK